MRYQAPINSSKANTQEYAYVNVRYKQPQQSQSILLSQPVPARSQDLAQSSADTRFAIAVAAYAQQLRGGQYNAQMQWDDIFKLAQSAAQPDEFGLRAEFLDLVKTAKSLSAEPVKP